MDSPLGTQEFPETPLNQEEVQGTSIPINKISNTDQVLGMLADVMKPKEAANTDTIIPETSEPQITPRKPLRPRNVIHDSIVQQLREGQTLTNKEGQTVAYVAPHTEEDVQVLTGMQKSFDTINSGGTIAPEAKMTIEGWKTAIPTLPKSEGAPNESIPQASVSLGFPSKVDWGTPTGQEEQHILGGEPSSIPEEPNKTEPTFNSSPETQRPPTFAKLEAKNASLDEEYEKRGIFKKFLSRLKGRAAPAWDTTKKISLEYKNLSIINKALISCGILGLGIATAGTGIPFAVSMAMRTLSGVGVWAQYISAKEEELKKSGRPGPLNKSENMKGFFLAFLTAYAFPQAFHLLGDGLNIIMDHTVDTKIFHGSGTAAIAPTDHVQTPSPLPLTGEDTINSDSLYGDQTSSDTVPIHTPEAPIAAQPSEPIIPTTSLTTQEILIRKGASVTSLLANPDYFPELKDLNGSQKTNAIQNVIALLQKNPQEYGLADNLWLSEGKTFDLAKLHNIIANGKINTQGAMLGIIERARLLS